MLHRNIDFLAEKNGATAICYTSQARRPSQRDFRPRCAERIGCHSTGAIGFAHFGARHARVTSFDVARKTNLSLPQLRRADLLGMLARSFRQTQFSMTTVFGGHLDFVGIPAEPAKSSGLPPAARRIKAYARRCSHLQPPAVALLDRLPDCKRTYVDDVANVHT